MTFILAKQFPFYMCVYVPFSTLHKLNKASTHVLGLTKFYCNICPGNGYWWPFNNKRNCCGITVFQWNFLRREFIISKYAAFWTALKFFAVWKFDSWHNSCAHHQDFMYIKFCYLFQTALIKQMLSALSEYYLIPSPLS